MENIHQGMIAMLLLFRRKSPLYTRKISAYSCPVHIIFPGLLKWAMVEDGVMS